MNTMLYSSVRLAYSKHCYVGHVYIFSEVNCKCDFFGVNIKIWIN